MAARSVRLGREAHWHRPVPAVFLRRGSGAGLHDDLPRAYDQQIDRVRLSRVRYRADAARAAGQRGGHGPRAQFHQMVHVLAHVCNNNDI